MVAPTDQTIRERLLEHPIWRVIEHQGRTLRWLARRTGYSEDLLLSVKAGRRKASSDFRTKCALALDIPEALLFLSGSVTEPTETAVA